VITWAILFFNGFYPVIDASTGGKIDGMIFAADKISPWPTTTPGSFGVMVAGQQKRILAKLSDMLVVAPIGVQKLKTAGKSPTKLRRANRLRTWTAAWGRAFSTAMFLCRWCIRALIRTRRVVLDHCSGVGIEEILGREGDLAVGLNRKAARTASPSRRWPQPVERIVHKSHPLPHRPVFPGFGGKNRSGGRESALPSISATTYSGVCPIASVFRHLLVMYSNCD